MPKPDRTIPMLSGAQEARLQGAIAESRQPRTEKRHVGSDEPASQALPVDRYAFPRQALGAPQVVTKVPVKLRLDAVAVETFKQTGPGWQTRMNDIIGAAAATFKIGTPVKTQRPPPRETPAK